MCRGRNHLGVCLAIVICMLSGCFSKDSDHDPAPAPAGGEEQVTVSQALSQQGFEVVAEVDYAGDTGYLGKNAAGKQCLVLQGTPRALGYQMGYLQPEATYKMVKDYPFNLLASLIGFSAQDAPELYAFVLGEIKFLCAGARARIPAELMEEMEGLALGATARGYALTTDEVLLLNEGLDTIFAILLSGKIPSLEELKDKLRQDQGWERFIQVIGDRVVFPRGKLALVGCNGFVVSDQATVGGKVYHGRDFMLPTGGIFQDAACMAVYLPARGYPFVSITAPGFIGQTAALNSEGLSMGVDVVFGGATRGTPGMGCLLVLRDVVQHCRNLDEAIGRMAGMDRGVPWLYILADDEKSARCTHGIVVESAMSTTEDGAEFTAEDPFPEWEQILLTCLMDKLDPQEIADHGIMIRNQAWEYPAAFDGQACFPAQGESYPDLVAASNHYIIPRMVFTTFNPWIFPIHSIYYRASETQERYDDLVGLLKQQYGRIDLAAARDIIDFMNPKWERWDTYKPGGEVEGHHDIFDNGERVMESLYGYYREDNPWVRIDLKAFIR